ncbi:GNAT family N-acetyltransferase [Bauldia sp.]|uniref:GNAT family N-acetyltransferase n=1 Tax=Bauldia sp. TaxID=2575872 RepID=UPI003BACC65A
MTDLRRLSRDTLPPLLDLAVRPDQTRFVAPNAETMAESMFEPSAELYGIWDGETPVGMIAVVDMSHPEQKLEAGDDPESLFIWRLMVDAGHQKRGHGTAAVTFAFDLARKKRLKRVGVSSIDAEGCAVPFYEALGFRRTGRVIDREVELVYQLG